MTMEEGQLAALRLDLDALRRKVDIMRDKTESLQQRADGLAHRVAYLEDRDAASTRRRLRAQRAVPAFRDPPHPFTPTCAQCGRSASARVHDVDTCV